MGVGRDKLTWMSEYAEFHSINENAYVKATLQVWGVVAAQPSGLAGQTLGNYANGLVQVISDKTFTSSYENCCSIGFS
jgi:hypothetical protein